MKNAGLWHLRRVGLLFLLMGVYSGDGFSQTIPAHRTTDWSVAGSYYDFQAYPGIVIDVTTFGVVGDGLTDNFLSVKTAIQSLGGARGTIVFPPGTYRINGSLAIPDSVSLIGSGADTTTLLFDAGENLHAISITGMVSTLELPLHSAYDIGSKKIVLALASPFVPGDMAEMIQDGQQHMTSSWAMTSLGQMIIIDSVAGDTLFLSQPLRMEYDSLLNPRLRKVTPRRVVSIECLKIVRLDSTTSSTANIGFTYALNCMVLGVESQKCNFAHVDVRRSSNITVRSSYFHEGHQYGEGGKAYGVCLHATSGSCLVVNNIFRKLRHAMLLQSGANGNVLAYNYSTEPVWSDPVLPSDAAGDMVLHGNYPYLNLFEGNIGQNIVIDDSHGKNGHHNTFFRNRADGYGIFMNNNPATDSTNFVGNEITNNGFLMGLYYLNGINHFQYGNNIRGVITPVGTNSLADVSYCFQQVPVWWNILSYFPTIGIPNVIGMLSIPARDRFLSGVSLATCADTVMLSSGIWHGSRPEEFFIQYVVYQRCSQSIVIQAIFPKREGVVRLELFSVSGSRLGGTITMPDDSGTIRWAWPFGVPDSGVYLVRISCQGMSKTVKLLIV